MACLSELPPSLALPKQPACAGGWGHEHSNADTFMLSYWGMESSCATGAQQGSAAPTDHYSAYEHSTDSAVFEQEALACDELLGFGSGSPLLAEECPVPDQCAKSCLQKCAALCSFDASGSVLQEVRDTIRQEMRKEQGILPCCYFRKHALLSSELRQAAVSWAIQVVAQFRVEQETLFLAVSFLDRFLSQTLDVVHMDGLHLATLACLSLAAKQTEVTQPTTAEWTWLVQGNSWGNKEQLTRMEWIIMDNLEWRGCTPTAWWFLHLFCYGLGTCPAPAICMAAYLLELSLLDAGCLSFSYSALAAAALLLGHSAVEQQVQECLEAYLEPLTILHLQALAPDLNLRQVHDACRILADLHCAACSLPPSAQQSDAALEGLPLARAKYCTDVWHNVGAWQTPIDVQTTLMRM